MQGDVIIFMEDMVSAKDFTMGPRKRLVLTARTCSLAADLIRQYEDRIFAVIIDLTVPQGGWMDECDFEEPGLAFASYLRRFLGVPKEKIVVLSFLIDEHRKQVLNNLGVPSSRIFGKDSASLEEVIAAIERDCEHTASAAGVS